MNIFNKHIGPEIKQNVSSRLAWQYKIIPYSIVDDIIQLYIEKERNVNGIQNEIEIVLGKKVKLYSVEKEEIELALKANYPNKETLSSQNILPKLITNKDRFINTLIEEARLMGSSDVHFEIRENSGLIRFRIDGHLLTKYIIPKTEYPATINAIKIKANMDIAEKRLPQDGRIHIINEKGKLDIRVSIIPTNYGEKVVFRLLNKDTSHIDLNNIGFSEEQLKVYKNGFLRSHGMVLISGPTGSGKTTTLYATLQRLNKDNCNILTIEDPVEYTMDGINQVQLKENIGLTFPVALKTFLRQDPDIIMVGEIRDPETAQIAIRAALTGHLVLSTIHTNSAWGIISRLIDMGVPEYLISATLNIAVAQRLVRLLCPKCKTEGRKIHPLAYEFLGNKAEKSFAPIGCDDCNYSGFKGRKALFEVIELDQKLKDIIKVEKFDSKGFQKYFKGSSLKEQALSLYNDGLSSFEEILPILLNI